MEKSKFVYVTYIRTTPEKLWQALTDPAWTQRYFFETRTESEWKKDAPWKIVNPHGGTVDAGTVLEIDPPKRLVLSWRNEHKPGLKEEGYSRMTYEIEKSGKDVKLTVVHEIDKPGSKLIEAVSGGWPMILSSLKSLLETGEAMEETKTWD